MSAQLTEQSAAEFLAEQFPALARYCPILPTISEPQTAFLISQAREALYGGAVGGGKSAALLAAALQYVDVPGYSALLLRRTYAELSKAGGLVPLAHEWLGSTDARWNEQRRTWTFPSGATLEFGHVEHENDKYAYQGAAYVFVGFDELTHFPEDVYLYIGFSRQRRRRGPAGKVPVRTRASANPGGVGHTWVKQRFIDNRQRGVLFIPAKVRDNPGLDAADYEASLAHLPDEQRRQLMDGDWNVIEGAAYPHFDEALHVLLPFEIPSGWDRFECMDFGSASSATAWYVVAVDYDGTLVVADELYGPRRVGDRRYEGDLPSATVPLILARRKTGWEPRDEDGWKVRSNVVWADPSTRNRAPITGYMGGQTSVAQEFADLGVPLSPGNNDRQAGFLRIAELLKPDPQRRFPHWHPRAGENGSPRMFVSRTCPELVEQLKTAPLEVAGKPLAGLAVHGDWESRYGHGHAALRYGVLSRPGASEEQRPEPQSHDEILRAHFNRLQDDWRDRLPVDDLASYWQ